MAIQGLERRQVIVADPSDQVGVMVQALEMLGMVGDVNREEVTESVRSDVEALNDCGELGLNYPYIPEDLIALDQVVEALDSGKFAGVYRDTYVDCLWVPSEGRGHFSANEFGGFAQSKTDADIPAHVRRAVFDTHSGYDMLLHFLDMPFDAERAEKGEQTQLEAIAEAVKRYESTHKGFSMGALSAKDIAMMSLMQRIKGSDVMPLEAGRMHDATMPRKLGLGPCRDQSVIGNVTTDLDQLRLEWTVGSRIPEAGVGLTVGPKEF